MAKCLLICYLFALAPVANPGAGLALEAQYGIKTKNCMPFWGRFFWVGCWGEVVRGQGSVVRGMGGGRPGFVPRKLPEAARRLSLSLPPTVDAEQRKSSAGVEGTLPLFDAPAEARADKPKGALVWDESGGMKWREWRLPGVVTRYWYQARLLCTRGTRPQSVRNKAAPLPNAVAALCG